MVGVCSYGGMAVVTKVSDFDAASMQKVVYPSIMGKIGDWRWNTSL